MNAINLENYRDYLEQVYVWSVDQDNMNGKRYIASYSDVFLQKVLNDTLFFADCVFDEFHGSSSSDSVFVRVPLVDDKRIRNRIHGGWSADTLYNPDGFDSDFWISKYLLESLLKVHISIEEDEMEYYGKLEDVFCRKSISYILITMKNDKYKELKNKGKVMVKYNESIKE